jgi:hypothetical protein
MPAITVATPVNPPLMAFPTEVMSLDSPNKTPSNACAGVKSVPSVAVLEPLVQVLGGCGLPVFSAGLGATRTDNA